MAQIHPGPPSAADPPLCRGCARSCQLSLLSPAPADFSVHSPTRERLPEGGSSPDSVVGSGAWIASQPFLHGRSLVFKTPAHVACGVSAS